MIRISLLVITLLLGLLSCIEKSDSAENYDSIKYNLVEPGTDIYVIKEKNVAEDKTRNKNFEAVYFQGDRPVKIERYDESGKLTDAFSVSAVTKLEYDGEGRVKYLKYFDKNGTRWEDDVFGYWSIEYIYDENNRVRMEIYRDAESRFLEVPMDNSGTIAKINFLAPVLAYEYIGNKLKIKALDQNFNLLKEVYGDKPCIPFIDCGEED